MKIVSVLLYLAVGAALHMVLIGSRFDWSVTTTWIVVFGWPLIVCAVGLVAALLVCLIIGIWEEFFS